MSLAIQGQARTPSLLPALSLKHFGVNPYGEAIYRVVWGPSRYYLVGGSWVERDGAANDDQQVALDGKDTSITRTVAEYRWVQKYPAPRWVLEKWLSSLAFGGTREQWDLAMLDPETNLLTLGPYPEKGEYEECYIFPVGEPPASAVERVIQMIEAGTRYSFEERKQAHYKELARQKRDEQNRREALLSELPRCVPISGAGPKGKDSSDYAAEIKFPKTADELGLPTQAHKFSQTRRTS